MREVFERYEEIVQLAFGDGTEPIADVARRAERLLEGIPVIVWEGDAQTFAFSFVSGDAEKVLGHASRRWTSEPTFWADHVVHPEDRDDAIAYCALATGKARDHAFEYRAQTSDGRTVRLADYVQVIMGKRRVPERLRGIMIDVEALAPSRSAAPRWQSPSRSDLEESVAESNA